MSESTSGRYVVTKVPKTNPYLNQKPKSRTISNKPLHDFPEASTDDFTKSKAQSDLEDDNRSSSDDMVKSATLPAWKRLPSQSLSFGSAEILTVTECYQQLESPTFTSVRITGVVLHYMTHSDQTFSIVLGDPLEKLSPPAILQKPRRIPGAPQQVSNRSTNPLYSPTATTKRKFVKRPMASKHGSLLQRQQHGSGLNRSPPPVKRTPTQCMRDILSRKPSVWVVIDPQRIPATEACRLGDLFTVWGELKLASDSSNPPSVKKSYADMTSHSVEIEKRTVRRHLLNARIIRKSNGTNMRLQQTALLARRQHLQAQKRPEDMP